MGKIHFDDLGRGSRSACGRLVSAGSDILLAIVPERVTCLMCLRCIEGARSGGAGITCPTLRPASPTNAVMSVMGPSLNDDGRPRAHP